MVARKAKVFPIKCRIGSRNGHHLAVIKSRCKKLFDIKVINYEKRCRLRRKREEKRRLENDKIEEWWKNRYAVIESRRVIRPKEREKLVEAHKRIIKNEKKIQERMRVLKAKGLAAHYLLMDLVMECCSGGVRDQDFEYRPSFGFYKRRPNS